MKITKITLLGTMLLLLSQLSFGQISFSHSLGGAFYGGEYASSPGIMYSPRLNLIELDRELTISLGTHIGFGFSSYSYEGAPTYAFDLPIMAEINFGHGANPDTRSDYGGFAGVGFGISSIKSSGAFSNEYESGMGIVFNGGVRALIKDYPVGVRVSYMLNLKKDFGNIYSLGIFYTFGDF